jgi:hypothetical protein
LGDAFVMALAGSEGPPFNFGNSGLNEADTAARTCCRLVSILVDEVADDNEITMEVGSVLATENVGVCLSIGAGTTYQGM